jgi:diaminopimelate epimerase
MLILSCFTKLTLLPVSPYNLETIDVKTQGAQIRYSNLYGETGSNVNFVKQDKINSFKVRTYERGVEDETLSCGTGVTAVAIAMYETGKTNSNQIQLHVPGGELKVSFEKVDQIYKNVFLTGPATFVFEGLINI